MEAIILAGGKAERLGEAAGGRPKALVELAGRPLAAYQVEQLASAGVTRVLVSCAAGQEGAFGAGRQPGGRVVDGGKELARFGLIPALHRQRALSRCGQHEVE